MSPFNKHWYAIYTRSRAEKKVARQLEEMGIEVYLPLEKTLRQWSDRKKIVYMPLFKSYVFVRVNNKESYYAIQVFGAVCYVCIQHSRVAIPDSQIEAIKTYLGELTIDEPISYLQVGNHVEVIYGVLKGLKGKLISTRNQRKIVVQIAGINQNLTLTLPSTLLRKITHRNDRPA